MEIKDGEREREGGGGERDREREKERELIARRRRDIPEAVSARYDHIYLEFCRRCNRIVHVPAACHVRKPLPSACARSTARPAYSFLANAGRRKKVESSVGDIPSRT